MSITIALAGNPNCGKTTLFNALTGATQYVGNWPGVTVEKKEGKLKGHKDVIIADLPGIYSLSPYSLEEVVARNYLINEKPDAILNIIDGTNLERNLYLSTQLMELGIPVVMAVNMMDLVRKNGDQINIKKLAEKLGCQVVEISALKGNGIDKAAQMAVDLAKSGKKTPAVHNFSDCVERVLDQIEDKLDASVPAEQRRYFAIKLLERDSKITDQLSKVPDVTEEINAIEKEMDDDTESIITNERYVYISSIIGDCLKKKVASGKMTISDKIDRVVTNRILALPIFAVVMWFVYYISVTTVGTIVTDWTNDVLFGEIVPPAVEGFLNAVGCADWLQGLILDGIVAGVGAVLGFVPQMIVLFFFLAILEDCGYMARVAFIMDRIFRKFGLSGKAFIPMLISSGCGIPGVMATRTIESDRDRKMSIMTTTFIPCGAKLPIIAMIAGAFFPNAEGNASAWVATSAYFIGVAAIVCSGIMLKKTKMFAGDPSPFVMELPQYHMPTAGNVLRSIWERASSFIKKAGTVILLSTIVLWFLMGYGFEGGAFGAVEDLNNSILAQIGKAIAWIFTPLGWTQLGHGWEMAVAAISGLIAKENVVATFGMLFNPNLEEVAEDGVEIWSNLQGALTPIAAYGYLVFNLLCAPCFAAIGAIRREMNSGKWTIFALCYQCLFAYGVALVIYQVGTVLTGGAANPVGLVAAVAIVAFFVYMLVRPYKESETLSVDTKNLVKSK
ncbi:ferrous iron transport protein B [Lachnospiraceae bacterium AM48-27BH]|nr:ferrous iron transport protein B [Lachnospiraceae bacterium AM48-27BH]